MPDKGERIDLPNGEAVYFVDEHPQPMMRHSYWRCKENGDRGKRLTGVTTAVKTLDYDPGRLLNWAAKTQCIGVARLFKLTKGDPEALSWLSSQESIWAELESYGLTFEDVRDLAATEGTNVHELAFRALAMGRPVPDLEAMSDRERRLAKAVMGAWLELEPEVIAAEQVVYSSRLGVAGRLDLLCTINGREGPGIIDLKTGRFLSAAAHTQVGGGYPLLAEECGVGKAEWALILQVDEEGNHQLIEAQGTPEDFEAAVATYRAAGRIDREAGKARKAAATRRKSQAEIDAAVAA